MPKSRGSKRPEAIAFRKEIGRRIASARSKKSWRVVDLARELGLSPSTIVSWEVGAASPSVENLAAIALKTEESVSFLVPSDLPERDSLERLADDLGVRLGYRRLAGLSHVPDPRLKRDIDGLLGAFVDDHGELPAVPKAHR